MKKKAVFLALGLTVALSAEACGDSASPTGGAAEGKGAYMQDKEAGALESESKGEPLSWLPLSSLTTHPQLRSSFEQLYDITGAVGGKGGGFYDRPAAYERQNITLYDVLTDSTSLTDFLRNESLQSEIDNIVNAEYTDIEDSQGAPALVNAYFELLPDQTEGLFEGSATISRAQAMTLLMRATTPVNESQAPEKDEAFTSVVGDTKYTNFAAPMNNHAYISTEQGLTDKTFQTTMTRGEYIYMLTNAIYNDEYARKCEESGTKDVRLSDVSLTTIKDAGSITFQEALSNPDKGLPTDIYKGLEKAVSLGFIAEGDLNWDEALTKSEAITLFMDAAYTYKLGMEHVDSVTAGTELESGTSDSQNDPMALGSTLRPIRDDYPDNNPQHQIAWNNFCENWNESDYGTTTKGKTQNDFIGYGDTGYDLGGTILQYRTTDKGYKVFYDTNTGRVYYSGMMLPTGSFWNDGHSMGAIGTYALERGYNSSFDVTYAERQEICGVYNGD